MSESFKTCPICGAANHHRVITCTTCGADLSTLTTTPTAGRSLASLPEYDYRYGDTDLFENSLAHVARIYTRIAVLGLGVVMLLGLGMIFAPALLAVNDGNDEDGDMAAADLASNTPRPAPGMPTVTVGPPTLTPSRTPPPSPTATATPTREPCFQEVQPQDGLFAIVSRCGHREYGAIIELVVEINDLRDETDIRPGDVIEVPWPTSTPDPNAAPPPAEDAGSGDAATSANAAAAVSTEDPADFDPFDVPTATLLPGIAFHTVAQGENIISVAVQYNANVEILSQLNPEITFSQCDFGLDYGGPRCSVFLREGQRVRVPAPTSTPTIPPTASGSETPTPTATATFNAPSAISPGDRTFFRRAELVTLRWIGSGTLSPTQVYHLRIENLTSGIVYTVDVTDHSFVIPSEWQGLEAGRYEFVWTVSVIESGAPDDPLHTTTPRTFTWEGKEQDES